MKANIQLHDCSFIASTCFFLISDTEASEFPPIFWYLISPLQTHSLPSETFLGQPYQALGGSGFSDTQVFNINIITFHIGSNLVYRKGFIDVEYDIYMEICDFIINVHLMSMSCIHIISYHEKNLKFVQKTFSQKMNMSQVCEQYYANGNTQ